MHINGQSVLTWIHMIPQHSNASESELFKNDTFVPRVSVNRTEETFLFILEASDLFTNRFQHTQQIITNTRVCLVISSIFYHSKSSTQFTEDKQFVWKLVYRAKGFL